MNTLVRCVNGHRFPINLKKHLNRRERYCPRCHQPIQVRSKLSFTPSLDWVARKEGYASAATKKQAEMEVAQRLAEFFGTLRGRRRRKARK